jgi:hypothetical protein
MRRWWISIVALAVLAPAAALGDPTEGGVFEMPRRDPRPVRGARIRATELRLYSHQNDNARYSLMVRSARVPTCPQALLDLGGELLANESWGHDDDSCDNHFGLTRAQADRAAALLSIAREDRSPIGERVTGTFTPSRRRARRGEPVEVVLTMTNPADAPAVRWQHGGRNRGPRDNQFTLSVERDGRPVTPIEAWDFGGLSALELLAPGASAEVRAPVSAWADVSQPGTYVVRCMYDTSFTQDGGDANRRTFGGAAVWERRFEGTIRFEVR